MEPKLRTRWQLETRWLRTIADYYFSEASAHDPLPAGGCLVALLQELLLLLLIIIMIMIIMIVLVTVIVVVIINIHINLHINININININTSTNIMMGM